MVTLFYLFTIPYRIQHCITTTTGTSHGSQMSRASASHPPPIPKVTTLNVDLTFANRGRGQTNDFKIDIRRFLVRCLALFVRAMTGWISVRIMRLSGIAGPGANGLMSQ